MKPYRVKLYMDCDKSTTGIMKYNTSYIIKANSPQDAFIKALEYLSPFTLRTKVVVDFYVRSFDRSDF